METIQEQIEVMQHFANGGEVEHFHIGVDHKWHLTTSPKWDWRVFDYRIKEVADPYAELKAAAKDPTKQVRANSARWVDGGDRPEKWKWSRPPENYEIRDKPKPMKKVKLLAWFGSNSLVWRVEGAKQGPGWKRVPSEDKAIEVEE